MTLILAGEDIVQLGETFSDPRLNGSIVATLDGGLQVAVVLVTPELAKAWLARNVKNRGLDNKLIRKYQASITRGDWQLNGEPIIFGIPSFIDADDAPLLDGQHRLKAVINTGRAVSALVVWNVKNEYQANMDIGKKRTVADVLGMNDLENSTALGAMARLIWRYRLDQWSPANTPTHQELLDAATARHEAMAEAVRIGRRINASTGGLTTSAAAAGFLVTSDIDRPMALEFAEQVATGAELKANAPALTLRNRVISSKSNAREHISAEDWFAFYIKAWNAYRAGQALKIMKWVRKVEEFPKAK